MHTTGAEARGRSSDNQGILEARKKAMVFKTVHLRFGLLNSAAAFAEVEARSAAGTARGPFGLSSAEVDEILAQGAAADFIAGHWGERGPEQSTGPQDLGAALYQALFAGAVGEAFHELRGATKLGREGLRIVLEIPLDPPALARLGRLPWELLFHPLSGRFVLENRRVLLTRHLNVLEPVLPLATGLPLRILLVIAAPRDQAILDVGRERSIIESALSPRRDLRIEDLPDATLEGLRAACLRSRPQIVHFIGHGVFDPLSDQAGLLFEDGAHGSHYGAATTLAQNLGDLGVRLVVLNACQTAMIPTEPLLGVAPALVSRGIPAVVAMQARISDLAAIAFSRAFYGTLAEGEGGDVAIAEARLALATANPGSFEWAVPTLFLDASDGRLFALDEPAVEPPRPQPGEIDPIEPAPVPPPRRRTVVSAFLHDRPLAALVGLGALAAALGAAATGLGFVTLRAREALLGLSPGLTYPKQQGLVTGLGAVGSLLWRGLSVLVSEHPVLQAGGWSLLFLLLALKAAARPARRPALVVGVLALSTVLLTLGGAFYRIALAADTRPEAGPSTGFGCGARLSANLADRAAFETCSWLVNDTPRNDGLRKDLGGLLGWLLAACLAGAVAGARLPLASRRLSGLRWLLVGAHGLLGLLLLYDLPRAHAFGTWGLCYPQVRIHEDCDPALAQATATGNCWAFDVSAGAEKKAVFFRGSGCPKGRDGSFLLLGTADSECLVPLSSLPRGITHGPNP